MLKKNGFTLTELVTILIILSVLAVVAIPKLINKSSFEDFTLRDQLISRLKLVQLQAMNAIPFDQNSDKEKNKICHWLVVKESCFYNESTFQRDGVCDEPSSINVCSDESYNQYNQVSFTDGLLDTAQYRFNRDGLIDNALEITQLNINGENNLNIIIEQEGYIHGNIQE